jgi:hypothetical protein
MRAAFLAPALLAAVALAPQLPLVEVRDWNARPLAAGTAVVTDAAGNIVAVAYVTDGRLDRALPWGPGYALRVAWGHVTREDIERGLAIWIYDSSNPLDVALLGSPEHASIRTYVYPLAVTLTDSMGRPVAGCSVVVIDEATGGRLYRGAGETDTTGTTWVVPVQPPSRHSQVPHGTFRIEAYCDGVMAASASYRIERGAAVTAEGWNARLVVNLAPSLPARGGLEARGYLAVRGVRFANGTAGSIIVPLTIAEGAAVLERAVPLLPEYGAEVYITAVRAGGVELAVLGGRRLVFNGSAQQLTSGVDLSRLASRVVVRAVGREGLERGDVALEILARGHIVARGQGRVEAVLPASELVGSYTLRVSVSVPGGTTEELPLAVGGPAVNITVAVVRVAVRAIDGFGQTRRDWDVEIAGVARGRGEVAAELVAGREYVARVAAPGLGFANETRFVAAEAAVTLVVPTARIQARVVDGFGRVRDDWPVEIVGVAAGRGSLPDVEVLGGRAYAVRAVAFGREFRQDVTVGVGEAKSVELRVPTARLSVVAVDDQGRPINARVTYVEVIGPLNVTLPAPPRDLELLAGDYEVRVAAMGRTGSARMTLRAGDVKNVTVVVPGITPATGLPVVHVVAACAAALVIALAAALLMRVRRRPGAST